MEVGGERVRARRDDFAARLERFRRIEVARASVGGSAMVVKGGEEGLEGEGERERARDGMDSYMDVVRSGPRGGGWIGDPYFTF